MDAECWDDRYNIRIAENYYDEKGRNHPMITERLLNIFREFNIFIVEEGGKEFYNIKDRIIDYLIELGEKRTENKVVNQLYLLAEANIKQVEKELMELRVKIPRYQS